jgi:hypothetical protein
VPTYQPAFRQRRFASGSCRTLSWFLPGSLSALVGKVGGQEESAGASGALHRGHLYRLRPLPDVCADVTGGREIGHRQVSAGVRSASAGSGPAA